MVPERVLPLLKVKVSAPVPPTRLPKMFQARVAVPSFRLPRLLLVMDQPLVAFSPVSVFEALLLPERVAPLLKVKVSAPALPLSVPTLLNVPPTPVTVPVSLPVTVQALEVLSAVRLLAPVPPLMLPVSVPPFRTKASVLLPPVRLPKPFQVSVAVLSFNVPDRKG